MEKIYDFYTTAEMDYFNDFGGFLKDLAGNGQKAWDAYYEALTIEHEIAGRGFGEKAYDTDCAHRALRAAKIMLG